jgi:hypothetical protein
MNTSVVASELTFSQTLWAVGIGAVCTGLFTALFVTIGGGWIVMRAGNREDERRTAAENHRADALLEAEQQRADALLTADQDRAEALRKADQERADALRQADGERTDQQRQLTEDHDRRQLEQEHEFQSRQALRESYARLLVVQRRSRQSSLGLARARNDQRERALIQAIQAHDEFIDEYHRLALDSNQTMWRELRRLRKVLDAMCQYAKEGDDAKCQSLSDAARHTRQNLERSFRERLGYAPLQDRKPLDEEYDKLIRG